jgi:hypothetical protein
VSGSQGPPSSSAPPAAQGGKRPVSAGPKIPTVRLPWYVWALLPIGLLALAAVRSILFEQAQGGIRPDGVIAAIRARNASNAGGVAGSQSGGFLAKARAIAKEGFQKGGGPK